MNRSQTAWRNFSLCSRNLCSTFGEGTFSFTHDLIFLALLLMPQKRKITAWTWDVLWMAARQWPHIAKLFFFFQYLYKVLVSEISLAAFYVHSINTPSCNWLHIYFSRYFHWLLSRLLPYTSYYTDIDELLGFFCSCLWNVISSSCVVKLLFLSFTSEEIDWSWIWRFCWEENVLYL